MAKPQTFIKPRRQRSRLLVSRLHLLSGKGMRCVSRHRVPRQATQPPAPLTSARRRIMAVNKPVNDNARKGAVKEPAAKIKAAKKSQGRAARGVDRVKRPQRWGELSRRKGMPATEDNPE